MGLLSHKVALVLEFRGSAVVFFTVAARIYTPTNSARGLLLLHTLAHTCYLVFLIRAILVGVR